MQLSQLAHRLKPEDDEARMLRDGVRRRNAPPFSTATLLGFRRVARLYVRGCVNKKPGGGHLLLCEP